MTSENLSPEHEWVLLREQVLERDGWECQNCNDGKDEGADLRAHHITPDASGGADEMDNLVSLCDRCHRELHRICGRGEYAPIERLRGVPPPDRETGLMGKADCAIVEVLREGRATPRYISRKSGENMKYVSKRLRCLQMAGIVSKIDRGVYELNTDEVPEGEER